jgi:hypothetical protein
LRVVPTNIQHGPKVQSSPWALGQSYV